MKLSLRKTFLIPTVTMVILGMTVASVVSFIISKNAIEKEIKFQMTQIVNGAIKHMNSWVERTELDLQNLSAQKDCQAAVQDTFVARGAQTSLIIQLGKIRDNYRFYELLYVANAKGEVVSSSDPEVVGNLNVSDQLCFQESMKGKTFLSNVVESKRTGKPVFMISTPIKRKIKQEEEATGVLCGVVDLAYFGRNFIYNVKIGKKGYAFLYNEEGMIIADPNESNILKLNARDSSQELLERKEGLVICTSGGVERMVAFKRSESTGWSIAVEATTEEVFNPVERFGYINTFVGLAVIILLCLTLWLITQKVINLLRKVSSQIDEDAQEIASVSGLLTSASRLLADGASQQAASIQETSSSLEGMASTTRQNAEHANHANRLMEDANQIVETANNAMFELTKSITEISKASEETQKIVKTIDEIAFQTNLLALNAAVEAARAGEAGAGFAVVADEVRSLAGRAADAARNTAVLIEGTVKKIQNGAGLVDKTNGAFSQVADSAYRVRTLVAEIAAASNEQAQGIEQINLTIAEVDKMIQRSVSNADESASASKQMCVQAGRIKNSVSELLNLVGGATKAPVNDSNSEDEFDSEDEFYI